MQRKQSQQSTKEIKSLDPKLQKSEDAKEQKKPSLQFGVESQHSSSQDAKSPLVSEQKQENSRSGTKLELSEFAASHLNNFNLFDRPKIKQPSPTNAEPQSNGSQQSTPQQQPRLRLIFEADPVNQFLVTNPTAIFKFIRPDRFLKLSEAEQLMVVEKLYEISSKCAYNAHLISEQVVTLNVGRSNQETLNFFRRRLPSCIDQEEQSLEEQSQLDGLNSSSQDIVFQLIHLGLRFASSKSAVNQQLAIKIVQIIRCICRGRRYLKCHLELIYQYVKTKVNKILAKSIRGDKLKCKEKEGFAKVDYCQQLLQAVIEQQSEFFTQNGKHNDEVVSAGRCPNYFYFSGYLSGILLGEKPLQMWPFIKGFAAAMWFRLHEWQLQMQDTQNLPVLFNCASVGFGGFECYFNGFKLYYRILPPINYQPPTVDSNGVLIAEFTPGKWNFLAIEHEKPFLARAQLIAVVNDKQVVNFPMDYPNFDKNNSKLNIVSICKNFVGQLTCFMLFKDQVNNPQKFVQLFKAYEFGVGVKCNQLQKLNPEIFDHKFTEKLFLMFTPQRTQNKIVYDYIEQNDGELLINCGVWYSQSKPFLTETGGLLSLLPLLEYISKLVELESDRKSLLFQTNQLAQDDYNQDVKDSNFHFEKKENDVLGQSNSQLINNYLKLVLAAVSDISMANRDSRFSESQKKDLSCFYKILFLTISKLPTVNPQIQQSVVNCQTIQLLADLRFALGDCQALNEEFFLNLMFTSDFWVNTQDMEVINEFWGFVKAIYSQNPVLYNNVFPIQNLIDFMVKISDISKEGAFCCQYHRKTFQMFFNQQSLLTRQSVILSQQRYLCEGQRVSESLKKTLKSDQIKLKRIKVDCQQVVYEISKYLEPIAAVLENVLTSGGEEILNQIQYIAKSLTVKSCPCFHLQMLQLLKVLLLDSRSDHDCASPIQFASRFLNVKGLQILLYLCQNASLDVKAMCIKIIDVLSSQTSLIQMRIDTDLITYLSHVILPEQLVQQHLAKQWQNQQNIVQHAICEEGELKFPTEQSQFEPTTELQTEGNDFGVMQQDAKKQTTLQFYAFQEVEHQKIDDSLDDQDNSRECEDGSFDEILPYKAPQAPRGGMKGKLPLFIDESDEEEQNLEAEKSQNNSSDNIESEEKEMGMEFKPESKELKTKFQNLVIESDEEESKPEVKPQKAKFVSLNLDLTEKELSGQASYQTTSKDWADKFQKDNQLSPFNDGFGKQNDEEPPKPSADVLMSRNLKGGAKKGFNFAAFNDESSEEEQIIKPSSKKNERIKFPQIETNSPVMSLPSCPKKKTFPLLIVEDSLKLNETKPQRKPLMIESESQDTQLQSQETEETKDVNENEEFILSKPVSRKRERQQLVLSSDDEQLNKNEKGDLGTTGTTNDLNFREEKSSSKKNKKAKPNFNLAIDTDEINKQFNYGGEHGSLQDEEYQNKLENDIQDLAKFCVQSMKRSNKKKSTFQELLEQQNLGSSDEEEKKAQDFCQKEPEEIFMVPQTVKGIKIIEIDTIRKEREAKNKPKLLELNDIPEESPLKSAQSLDNSNDQEQLDDEVNHSGRVERFLLNLQCEEHELNEQKQNQNAKRSSDDHEQGSNEFDMEGSIDMYTQELENLYTSCLEWLLNRAPSGLFKNLVIDDYDKITFKPALQILMTLVSYSNNLVRQRALQDLFMLAQWDSYCLYFHDQSQQIIANQNGQIILQHPKFHTWLLELLMPYQDLIQIVAKKNTRQSVMSESSRAVYDMGCKLHTLLLKNACLNPEEDGFKKVNLLTRWPVLIQAQFEAAAQAKLAKDDFEQQSIETAHGLIRVLLTSLIKQLREEAMKSRPPLSLNNAYYKNMIHIAVQVEELILSSHQKSPAQLASGQNSKVHLSDVNEPLFTWLQRGFLFGTTSTDGEDWAEWDLLETLLQALDQLLVSSANKQQKDKKPSKQDDQTVTDADCNFAKSPSAIEILMYEGKPSQPSPVHANVQVKPSRMGAIVNTINNGLNQAVQSLTQLQQEPQQLPENTFMKAMMNLICLAISQSYNKELTVVWLDRLERFVKQLLLVSEAWKLKTDSYNTNVQRKIAEQVSFAFTFLFHEVHNAGTPTNQQLNFPSKFTTSPQQANVQHSKLFQQSLKSLFIFLINIAHSNSGVKNRKDQSASRIILKDILVKEFSSNKNDQFESLLSTEDIVFLKENNFEDFPELFYQNDWKVTFFHNSIIQGIVQRQLNLKLLEQFDVKRRNFVQRVREVESKTEKAKEEILKKIQSDTIDAIGVLSELEFERKNKDALLLDNFMRNRQGKRQEITKKVQGARGMWRQDYDHKFYDVNLHLTGEGTRVLLKDRSSNQFMLIKDNSEQQAKQIEQMIFNKVENKEARALQNSHSYLELKSELLELAYPSQKVLPQQQIVVEESTPNESEESECEDEELNRHLGQQGVKVIQQNITVSHFSKRLSLAQRQDLKRVYVTHLKEQLFLSKIPKRKEVIECECEMLLPLENRKGTLCMTNFELIFFYDLDLEECACKSTIHFFNIQLKEDKPFQKEVPLCFIKELQKRRFIGQRTALEVFLCDNKSLLFKFANSETRDEVAKKILRQRKNKCKNLKYYTSLEPKWILKKKSLIEDWQNWKISNFDYIMQLNQLSGRSFNDISQYPVLPWILNNYSNAKAPDLQAINQVARGGAPPGNFRDLTKNIQLIGSAVRQAEFKRKFDDNEGFIGLDDRFHCGSHYSNPGIVLHYLSRLYPYLEANVELHGKTMDHPDRVFASLEFSFTNALNDFSDVRELIPEFYFLPEMFLNLNNINFGLKQDGTRVNHVKLPPWAKQDPFKFVQVMREAFESPYVSANLHTWIDYIFGFKQRGPEAQMCLNTFSRITYQPEQPDDFDIAQEPDPNLRNAYEIQAYNYGQTPTQLFKLNERHPPKLGQLQSLRSNLVVDIEAHLKVFKPVSGPKIPQGKQPKQAPLITKDSILKAKFVDDQRIVGIAKDGFAQHFVWLPRPHDLNPTTPFSLGGDKKMTFDTHEKEGGVEQIDRSIKKFDLPIQILKEGKQIVKGGFWDGRLAFCPTEGSTEPYFELQGHNSTITTLVCDKKESIMVTGSKTGEVIIWKNSEFDFTLLNNDPKTQTESQWVIFKQLNDHDRQVSCLQMNEEMCVFVTGSYDGTCNLYNMHSGKLLRTFKHPTMAPVYSCFVALSPLAICSFFSREDHLWTVYSINGTLLNDTAKLNASEKSQIQKTLTEDCSHIIACQVIKDSQHIDKLVYGTEKGFIILRLLPDMTRIRKLVVANNNPVLSILVSPDRRFLHVGCGDGGLIVITERSLGPQQEKQIAQKK